MAGEGIESRTKRQRQKFEEKVDVLVKGGLISEKEAAEIRKGPKDAIETDHRAKQLDVLERAS